jgi:hypothetical protein
MGEQARKASSDKGRCHCRGSPSHEMRPKSTILLCNFASTNDRYRGQNLFDNVLPDGSGEDVLPWKFVSLILPFY